MKTIVQFCCTSAGLCVPVHVCVYVCVCACVCLKGEYIKYVLLPCENMHLCMCWCLSVCACERLCVQE